MSRSLGDRFAKEIGVSWEPEIMRFEITKECHFMILGSDGLFEFMSNETIMNLVIPFYQRNDPDGAC
jgi:serine/threonine protein phosphatase PrpC